MQNLARMKLRPWLLPVAIVLFALILRLFNLAELFYFTHDEETIVWRTMSLLRDKNLFLLGGVTPLHVHLGPWFYYLSAVILWFAKLNPLGWGAAGAIVGAFTTLLIYVLGKKFYSRRVGIIAAALNAVSFLSITYDRHWWPLVLDPLLSVSALFILTQLANKKYQLAPILGVLLALGFHSDPSNWGLLILSVVVFYKYKLPLKQKSILAGFAIFLFSFAPLIAFDISNQGANLKGVNQYFTETKPDQGLSFGRLQDTLLYIPQSLSRLLVSESTDLSHSYAYCPKYSKTRLDNASAIMVLTTTAALAFFLLRKSKRKIDWIIKAYLVVLILGINIYGNFFSSDLFDHYLATLFPVFFLVVATFADKLLKKQQLFTVLVLSLLVLLNLNAVRNTTNSQGYLDKLAAVGWVSANLGNKPFALDSQGECFRYNGIRYLFTLAGHDPDLSFVDPNFFWLYDKLPQVSYPETLVVFSSVKDNQKNSKIYSQNLIEKKQFGSTQVLIIDNSSGEFSIEF